MLLCSLWRKNLRPVRYGNYIHDAYIDSYDAEYVRLEDDGSWSVGFERPEGLEAVQRWLKLGRAWAPQNFADLGQGDLLALMASEIRTVMEDAGYGVS